MLEDKSYVQRWYRSARAEAKAWHARRAKFMLERLKSGRHPDTDPGFWKGWDDGAPPSFPLQLPWTWIAIAASALGLAALIVLLIRRRRARA